MIFILAMVVKTCKWSELGILQWRILLGVCKLTTIGNNTCYYCYIEGDRLFLKKIASVYVMLMKMPPIWKNQEVGGGYGKLLCSIVG